MIYSSAGLIIRFGCLIAFCLTMLTTVARGKEHLCQQDSQLIAVRYVLDLKNKADAILNNSEHPLAPLKVQLLANIEFDLLGKFALGRYWYKATTEQRIEYQGLFRKTVLHTLASHVLEFRGGKVEIARQYPIGAGDVLVKSRVLSPQGKATLIGWRIGFRNCLPRAVDLLKDGVSLMTIKHQEFNAVASRSGIDGLLLKMKVLSSRQDQRMNASDTEQQYVRTLLNQLLQETAKKLRQPNS